MCEPKRITTAADAREMVDVCASILSRSEMGEVGLAALNYPKALAQAMNVHAGQVFGFEDFAQLMLDLARDVNRNKGLAS
jgi:hypothetical protein